MDALQRYTRAMKRQPVDQVPIGAMIGLSYWSRGLGVRAHLARHMASHPLRWVEFQEEMGFDPILFPYWFRESSFVNWPNAVFRWPAGSARDWAAHNQVVGKVPEGIVVRRSIVTPIGEISSLMRQSSLASSVLKQKDVLSYPLKTELDLDHLVHRPDPAQLDTAILEHLISTVGSRALVMLVVPGPFDEACEWRGPLHLFTDAFERPEWVHRLLRGLTDYSLQLVHRLASTGLPSLMIDESFVGYGTSQGLFREFVLPYNQEIAAACREAGILTSFHVCRRSSALLELMADVGSDAIEPLVPWGRGGDADLADARQRVGHRVALMGGFDEEVLATGEVEDVQAETRKCLEAAGGMPGYVLRAAWQLFDAKPENLTAFVDTARELGRY